MPAKKAAVKEKPVGKKAEQTESAKTAPVRSPRNVAIPANEIDAWSVLHYPHLAEKSMKMVESENKLVFMVRRNSKRMEIKAAIEKAFSVKVTKVNFEITMTGQKKAYVKLSPEFSAADIATRMGMV